MVSHIAETEDVPKGLKQKQENVKTLRYCEAVSVRLSVLLEILRVLRQPDCHTNRDRDDERILSSVGFSVARNGEVKMVLGVVVFVPLGNGIRLCIGFNGVINGKGLASKEVFLSNAF